MLKTKTILIVDDNASISKPLGMLLKSHGYQVRTTALGADPTITLAPFADVILLDGHLKDIPGPVVCKNIKSNAKTRHIPVIMFSADMGVKIRAIQAGADDFIEKPFAMVDLVKKIKHYTH